MGRTGRPPLPVGTFGEIWVVRLDSGKHRAECLYRDHDGVTRRTKRVGATPSKAKALLKKSLLDRNIGDSPDDLTADTRFRVVCEAWWTEFAADTSKSPGTRRQYRDRLDNQVIPAFGELLVREVTLARIGNLIKTVTDQNGPSVAKLTRTVLSKVMGFAGRHGAVDRNPVKDVESIQQEVQKANRHLELAEAIELRNLIHGDKRARERDLPDFTDFMLATGLRIGEAAAVTWQALDLEAETVEVRGTVVREKGVGLYIKWKPKTKSGYRTLGLPWWTVEMLKTRRARMMRIDLSLVADEAPVFTAPRGGLRDPNNTQADLRELFDQPDKNGVPTTQWTWVTSHVWRKTVATLMDEAGLSAREAADQLGHAKVSMTQDRYFGRRKVVTSAKEVMGAVVTR